MKKEKSKNQIRIFGSLRVMVLCSVFVAISIVCGKYLAIRGGDVLRFSFENLPIILAGMAFGPVAGAAVGVVADLIGCILVGYAINPIITLAGALIGAIGGIMFRVCRKLPWWLCVTLTVTACHTIGSVVVKTIGLAAFYSMPIWELMLWRLLNYVIIGVIEGVLIYILLKNKALRKQLLMYREEDVK
ncbi:MAG: folate family ECF transporter S component [Ruminococcaceae bacterium]|nr:folate family ECF transporter S component [Oscillospiraceae bacterium]